MLKERMTPEEIAHLTGYSRQTINKWVRKEGWQPLRDTASVAAKRAPSMSMSKSGVYPQRPARGGDARHLFSHDSDLESLLLTLSKELTPASRSSLCLCCCARDHRVTASVRIRDR